MPKTEARDVILEILRNADGEWTGKTKLFKAFYFAHLYYAGANPGILTNWPIACMPQGPGINNSVKLFTGLVDDGLMTTEMVHDGPYPEYRYRLTDKARNAGSLPDAARDAIKTATLFCKDRSASELSQLTHERSRSWIQGNVGDILDIYIDLIPEDEYQSRLEEIGRLENCLPKFLQEKTA